MKTLYLLRHAKSSWDDPSLPDHDRPLAPRGRRAAPQMAVWLRSHATRPDLVFCSTAERARETWNLIAPELLPTPEVELHREIYDADGHELVDVARRAPDRAAVLMLVGHNPAMEDAAQLLTGSGDIHALRTMRKKYPTAAVAELTFQADAWAECAPGTGRLERFVRPKDLG